MDVRDVRVIMDVCVEEMVEMLQMSGVLVYRSC